MALLIRSSLFLSLLGATLRAHDWNGLALDRSGNAYSIDAEDGYIWKIAPDGKVSTFLPTDRGKDLGHPHHLAIDDSGTLWLASG
jgi:hypothetical protein